MIQLELTDSEANQLFSHLSGVIAKGSRSTTPSFAIRIMSKIQKGFMNGKENRDACNGSDCDYCGGNCPKLNQKRGEK